jgi:hypothetical protein
MQITYKTAILSALLATGAAASDLEYCHGSGATGTCQGITFASLAATCYPLNATVGTVDSVTGTSAGIKYTLFTGAACTGTASAVFGPGVNTLVAPFAGKVLSISASIPVVSTWTARGCFTDTNSGTRALAADFSLNTGLTIERCQAACDAGGYGFAGVEFGRECYCDYSIRFSAVAAAATECNVPCGGNTNQTCGGASRINIFGNGKALPTTPAAVVGPGAISWASNGCFTDNSIGTRTLALHLEPATGGVTPQTCVNTCAAANQTVAGVEFGSECWCGNVVNVNATKVADNQCGTACDANPAFFCGDNNRINIFKRP